MGAWGAGLYSSDMAADMCATIKSVLRLPLDEDRIVDILRDCEGHAANDPNDEDYTTFWLVLADQFEKRGVAHGPTRQKAMTIIERGEDLDMMEKRGMKLVDLRKRGAKLAELRARLAATPECSKPRTTIKGPEPYVLEIGVLYACPVRGANINPVGGKKNFDGSTWTPDGWRQFVILNRGRAFGYLAWYQPLVCKKPVREKPRLVYRGWDGRGNAVNGITISETMYPSSHDWGKWYGPQNLPTEGPKIVRSLAEILGQSLKSKN